LIDQKRNKYCTANLDNVIKQLGNIICSVGTKFSVTRYKTCNKWKDKADGKLFYGNKHYDNEK
jgi:hypothetical protein